MNISCQQGHIVHPDRPAQGIRDLKNAGFENVMAGVGVWFPDFYGIQKDVEQTDEEEHRPIAERYSALFRAYRENGIRVSVVCGPSFAFLDPYQNKTVRGKHSKADGTLNLETIAAAEKEMMAFAIEAVKESIAFCAREKVKYLMIDAASGDGIYGREWELNHDFYMNFAGRAKDAGVCILLRNQYRVIGGHMVRGICSEADAAAEWIDRLNGEAGSECFGFCVDTGICTICGNDIQEFIRGLGSRVKAVMLRDGDGRGDSLLLPFTCVNGGRTVTDWMGVIRGLRDIAFDGELILNFSHTIGGFSPLLRPTLFKLAYEVALFFKWQIGLEQSLKKYQSIVLFGAGNMCRNYMKCYGEKYPPLFTCDNNRNLWGTQFCGLTVKSPEELKNLPENCGVYICNTFYREIREQLEEMGVRHIEFFNDEYMPSFHFDRLERRGNAETRSSDPKCDK